MMVAEIRQKYWLPLEKSHKPSAWEALDAGYGASHRAYHAWGHIAELLRKLDEFSALSTRPDLVAAAIFWHDAVYMTQKPDDGRRSDHENIRDSGALFRRYTLLNTSDADAVHELIMATADHIHAKASEERYPGFSNDLDLFLDLDLSPLAATWDEFAANSQKLRFEYSWLPEAVFCLGQVAMLERFANKNAQLFRRAETRQAWRRTAIANLSRCLGELHTKLEQLAGGGNGHAG